jgi:hypothetical protein
MHTKFWMENLKENRGLDGRKNSGLLSTRMISWATASFSRTLLHLVHRTKHDMTESHSHPIQCYSCTDRRKQHDVSPHRWPAILMAVFQENAETITALSLWRNTRPRLRRDAESALYSKSEATAACAKPKAACKLSSTYAACKLNSHRLTPPVHWTLIDLRRLYTGLFSTYAACTLASSRLTPPVHWPLLDLGRLYTGLFSTYAPS